MLIIISSITSIFLMIFLRPLKIFEVFEAIKKVIFGFLRLKRKRILVIESVFCWILGWFKAEITLMILRVYFLNLGQEVTGRSSLNCNDFVDNLLLNILIKFFFI